MSDSGRSRMKRGSTPNGRGPLGSTRRTGDSNGGVGSAARLVEFMELLKELHPEGGGQDFTWGNMDGGGIGHSSGPQGFGGLGQSTVSKGINSLPRYTGFDKALKGGLAPGVDRSGGPQYRQDTPIGRIAQGRAQSDDKGFTPQAAQDMIGDFVKNMLGRR